MRVKNKHCIECGHYLWFMTGADLTCVNKSCGRYGYHSYSRETMEKELKFVEEEDYDEERMKG